MPRVHQEADQNPECLRISIDTKATVKIGNLSRQGRTRQAEAPPALDHDMHWETPLIPLGILSVVSGLLTIVFCQGKETSDLIADALLLWWNQNKSRYGDLKEWVINLDHGPQLASCRTQFMKRMVQFADTTGLRVRLVYDPPYHSKYNPLERCWGTLEKHWNGSILDSVDQTIQTAATMTWKGIHPLVLRIEHAYQKGVKLLKKEFLPYQQRLIRSLTLPKGDLLIIPTGILFSS